MSYSAYEKAVNGAMLLPYWLAGGYLSQNRHELVNYIGARQSLDIAREYGLRPEYIVDVGSRNGEFSVWWHRRYPGVPVDAIDAEGVFPPFAMRKIAARIPDRRLDDLTAHVPYVPTWLKVDIEQHTADALETGQVLLSKCEFAHVEVMGRIGRVDVSDQPTRIFDAMRRAGFTRSSCVSSGWGVNGAYTLAEFCFWRAHK